jgi:hypothetical protein
MVQAKTELYGKVLAYRITCSWVVMPSSMCDRFALDLKAARLAGVVRQIWSSDAAPFSTVAQSEALETPASHVATRLEGRGMIDDEEAMWPRVVPWALQIEALLFACTSSAKGAGGVA